MTRTLVDAYERTRNGYSSDRVLADPELRYRFFDCCRLLQIEESSDKLARMLLNCRKRGHLAGRRARVTRFEDQEYRFAAEIAIRHLKRKWQVTLDDVICSDELLAEFDSICIDLFAGIPVLQHRWAALSLRKSRSITPEILSHAIPATTVHLSRANDINVDKIPDTSGLYVFLAKDEYLYVGEASNLRSRLKKHLDHSDNKRLARYLWDRGSDELMIELHVLATDVTTKARRALEVELIRSRRPLFNILGALADSA